MTETRRASHIHTPEWQSFEARMRARLEERLAARRRRRRRMLGGLAASLLGGVATVGVTLVLLSGDPTMPAVGAPAQPAMSAPVRAPLPTFPETPVGTSGVPAETPASSAEAEREIETPPAEPRPQARDTRDERDTPRDSQRARTAASIRPPATTVDSPPAARRPSPAAAFRPFEPVREAPAPPRPPSEPAPANGTPPEVTAPANAVTPAPVATPPPIDPREPVRHAIDRYRTAYERLDAAAAHAVWPTVDRGALTRAFSSLATQQLTFEGCSIDVAGTTAQATCRGRARVTPRVGGGTETARREWRFSLRDVGGEWIIERAEVRR